MTLENPRDPRPSGGEGPAPCRNCAAPTMQIAHGTIAGQEALFIPLCDGCYRRDAAAKDLVNDGRSIPPPDH